jgi:branched-chain amino acid transport system ATP-binding protein
MSDVLLDVKDLAVTYGDAGALFGVSFQIQAKQAVAILGANGAGKSSLASCVAGVVPAAGGSVSFAGKDVTNTSAHQLARTGLAYVPEGRGIFPHLSVNDNLRAMLNTAVPKSDRKAALERAFSIFPILGERRKQLAGTLSGGEQQMLALARVLAAPPRLLIADEMSLGLAPLLVDAVFDGLERARAEGVSIMLIEQYVERALAFADVAVVMRHGRVVWQGPADQAEHEALAGYLGESPDLGTPTG